MAAASKQYILERLAEYLEWSIEYLRLIREDRIEQAAKVIKEYEQRLEELKAEAIKKEKNNEHE